MAKRRVGKSAASVLNEWNGSVRGTTAWAVEGGLRMLRDRALDHYHSEMSVQDVFEIFTPPNLRSMAQDVVKYFSIQKAYYLYCSMLTGTRNCAVKMSFAQADFAWPNDAGFDYADRDHPAYQKLVDFVTWRLELGRQFGLAEAGWTRLNEICGRQFGPRAVKFYWPIVLPLMKLGSNGSAHTVEVIERLEQKRHTFRVPQISPELRTACKETNSFLSGLMLLPGRPANRDDAVNLSMEVNYIPDWSPPIYLDVNGIEGGSLTRRRLAAW